MTLDDIIDRYPQMFLLCFHFYFYIVLVDEYRKSKATTSMRHSHLDIYLMYRGLEH